ncbi:hypothetical protein AALK14_14080 [Butyricimonas hominis]|uniref:hypothetical protein n=1 Tax=Butyricimonas TaxID=574697 RepID=UPI003511637A
MKKKLLLYVTLGISLLTVSCSDDGELPLKDDFVSCRFEFPQGTTAADKEIQRIHEEAGVYLIYKKITSRDLNRNWIDPGETSYMGTMIKEENVTFYLEFLNDNLLKYVDGQYLKNALPVYFYFLKHLESTKGSRPTVVDLRTDGLDFWALALSKEEIEDFSVQERAILRNRLMYPILKKLVSKGIISAPDNFFVGIDYETAISKKSTTSTGSRDRNYYCYRGFVDFVDESDFRYTNIPSISMVKAINADLLSYIRIALMYTEEEFQEEYPQQEFSLVNERYQILTSHLKKDYGVDLKAIAKGN